MLRLLCTLILGVFPLASIRAQPVRGPSIPLRPDLTVTAALTFLRQLDPALDQKAPAGPIRFNRKEDTVGFRVPVPEVTVGQTSGGLPGTKIRTSLTVRCTVFVSYDLSRIKVRRGLLQLPAPKVVAAYTDPPGERGTMHYDCQFLRSDWTPWDKATLDRLNYQLLDDALVEARAEYLRELHEKLEDEFAERLSGKLEALARGRSSSQ